MPTPTNRQYQMYRIAKITEEINAIKSIPTDSDVLPVITDTLAELKKQLKEALSKYYEAVKEKK